MYQNKRDVLLSIKPYFANQILNNIKRVEFRKSNFGSAIDKVYIYSSYPEMCIKGYFIAEQIIKDSPFNLWEKYGCVGGIDKKEFFDYYKGKEFGYALLIDKVKTFKKDFIPKEKNKDFRPPQSYCYLSVELKKSIEEYL